MEVLGESIEMKVFGSSATPSIYELDECNSIDCINSLVPKFYLQDIMEDKLEVALTLDTRDAVHEEEVSSYLALLDKGELVTSKTE
ncbi:hypothetical protein PSY31_22310, partial [Shigella flexneri]|nr:hypothetical protein [Shigella flexneri]